jgi:hypothetical protein
VVTIADVGNTLGAFDAKSDDSVGLELGVRVGAVVGCAVVGCALGTELGAGDKLGALDTDSDGEREGDSVRTVVGLVVGVVVGCAVVGCALGTELGAWDTLGALDTDSDGEREGDSVGTVVGVVMGWAVVSCAGSELGACVGWQLPPTQLHRRAPGTYSDEWQGQCRNAVLPMLMTESAMMTDARAVHDRNA